MVLPEGVQVLGLLPTAAPGVFVGRVSQGRARRASQTAWVTSSVTATSLRGGARVMKTEEATLFSCLEAMISSCGAEILIPTGRQGPKFRPAPLSCREPLSRGPNKSSKYVSLALQQAWNPFRESSNLGVLGASLDFFFPGPYKPPPPLQAPPLPPNNPIQTNFLRSTHSRRVL